MKALLGSVRQEQSRYFRHVQGLKGLFATLPSFGEGPGPGEYGARNIVTPTAGGSSELIMLSLLVGSPPLLANM